VLSQRPRPAEFAEGDFGDPFGGFGHQAMACETPGPARKRDGAAHAVVGKVDAAINSQGPSFRTIGRSTLAPSHL